MLQVYQLMHLLVARIALFKRLLASRRSPESGVSLAPARCCWRKLQVEGLKLF